MDAFHEWFPQEDQLEDDEKHFYVAVQLFDVSSGANIVNGTQL